MLSGEPVADDRARRAARARRGPAVPLGAGAVPGSASESPDAYRWWDEDGAGPAATPTTLLAAATAGDAEALGPLLFNDLETPVAARHPEVERGEDALLCEPARSAP